MRKFFHAENLAFFAFNQEFIGINSLDADGFSKWVILCQFTDNIQFKQIQCL